MLRLLRQDLARVPRIHRGPNDGDSDLHDHHLGVPLTRRLPLLLLHEPDLCQGRQAGTPLYARCRPLAG